MAVLSVEKAALEALLILLGPAVTYGVSSHIDKSCIRSFPSLLVRWSIPATILGRALIGYYTKLKLKVNETLNMYNGPNSRHSTTLSRFCSTILNLWASLFLLCLSW